MATRSPKSKKADEDFKQYQEYASKAKQSDERASNLSSESTRIMGTLNYLGGREAGDNAEASRQKRVIMADEEAQYSKMNAERKRNDYLKSSNEAYNETRKLEDVNKKNKWKGTM
jgi:hypothetical protein